MLDYLLKQRNKKSGFTLVELVIVIAVIAILVAILIPSFSGVIDSAAENAFLASCRNDLTDQLAKAQGEYKAIPSGNATETITRTNNVEAQEIVYDEINDDLSVTFNYAPGAMSWGKVTSLKEQDSGKVFTIGIVSSDSSLAIKEAVRSEYDYEKLVNGLTLLPLVYKDADSEYHPLVMNYASEQDGKVWKFTIKDGFKWEDGEPVTAEDLLFTLQYGGNFGDTYSDYSLSADKMTLTLSRVTANARAITGMTTTTLMPKHIYENNSNPTVEQQRMGYGPYMLAKYNKTANTMTFVVNPNYSGSPYFRQIKVKIFASADTMYTALLNGDIDMPWGYGSSVPAAYQDKMTSENGVGTMSVSAGNIKALAFNTREGYLFNNENLRKAVSFALDYNNLTSIGSAYSVVANTGIVPSTIEGYTDTAKNAQNLEKAAQFMSAAGYTKNANGFYAKGGTEISFDLTFNSGDTIQVNSADRIKTQLEAFGIHVNLDGLAKANYQAKTANMMARQEGHDVNMTACIMGWTAFGMNNAASTYINGNNGTQGACGVFDETYVGYVSGMTGATSMDSYNSAAAGAQNWYSAHVPAIALYWDVNMYAYSNDYTGLVYDATLGLNNVHTWLSIRPAA